MTWPYFRIASPSGIAARAILCPAGISRLVISETDPLSDNPAASGRLATATLSLSRRRRAKSSKCSGMPVFYLIKPDPERHNDELMSRERSQDQWIQSAVLQFEPPLILYAARILGDIDRARDVVQETFLRLCGQIRAACKVAAAAHNLDLIVAERAPETSREMTRLSADQLRLLLSTSEVLYANHQIDL